MNFFLQGNSYLLTSETKSWKHHSQAFIFSTRIPEMTSCIRRSLLSVILAALSWRLLKTFPRVVWQKMRAIEKTTPPNVCQPTKFHKREKTRSISRGAESDLKLEKTWWIGTMSLEIKFIKYPEVLSARIWWRVFRICKKRKRHKIINDKVKFNFEFCVLLHPQKRNVDKSCSVATR